LKVLTYLVNIIQNNIVNRVLVDHRQALPATTG
jgi:hypothetical protein